MSGPALALYVVGPGRAGLGVARAARAAGVHVVGLGGRRAGQGDPTLGAAFVPAADAAHDPALARARVVLVAVQDRELAAAVGALAGAPLPAGAVVLQASGAVDPAAAFAPLRAAGRACGTFHPLAALADPARAPEVLRGAWVGVDGDPPAADAARALAARLGARTLDIPAGDRARYHAAAVFASNYPAALAAAAERLLDCAGVPADEARGAVRHLLGSAVANLAAGGGAGAALTGPVARGDADTVARHLAALGDAPDLDALYRALARATLALAAAGPAPPAASAQRAIAGLLAGPADRPPTPS